ncbi:MAG: prepilin peptidase [Halobacteriovoraceae bacterium]|nr:prepilin peptidase [Halobacteriovoraceae bacterium]
MENFVIRFFSFLFGICIGSFLNAVIYRLPKGISLSASRSHCPGCDKLIFWYENIPLISWIFLRGKCSGCSAKISIQYPFIELLVGVFALLVTPMQYSGFQIYYYFFYVSVFATFVAMFFIDLKHKLLPNSLNIYLAIILFSKVVMNKGYDHWLLGAAIGVLFPLGVTYLFYLLKGQVGLGGGDIKLYGALGLYLGPLGVVHNIFLSCFLGALVGGSLIVLKVIDRKTPVPFGPFIIVVAATQIFIPEQFRWFMENVLYLTV